MPIENAKPGQLVKPADCFSDPRAEILLYPILRRDLQPHASKFGVQKDPPMSDCALRLIKRAPSTRVDAKQLFSYFASRISDINQAVASRLGDAPIVPVRISKGNTAASGESKQNIRMTAPNACFLGDGSEYGEIFDYVDFGGEANTFLLKVGSKHDPSTSELTRLLIKDSKRVWQTIGVDRYRTLLQKIGLNVASLKKDKGLWKEMKTAPFLMACRESPLVACAPNDGLDGNGDDEMPRMELHWRLRSAEQIVIQNDLTNFNLFREHLYVAPQEDSIEDFYSALGTPGLSSIVDSEPRLGARSVDQNKAHQLREVVLERARLFLHDHHSVGTILHDIKWLENNLVVQVVQSLALRRTLRTPHVSLLEKRTAALTAGEGSKQMLSITSNYDVFEVSQSIVRVIIERPKPQTFMMFEMFLITPLLKLRARGYNVDRVLRKRAAEEAKATETLKQKQREEERRRQLEEQRQIEDSQNQRSGHPLAPVVGLETPPEEEEDYDDDVAAGASDGNPSENIRNLMPGAFHNSPDQPSKSNGVEKKPKGILSQLSQQFGLNNRSRASAPISNPLAPPPYSTYDPQPQGLGNTEAATPPDRITSNLQSAIKASRPYNGSDLFSRPDTHNVKETSSYCDIKPGHDLVLHWKRPKRNANLPWRSNDQRIRFPSKQSSRY